MDNNLKMLIILRKRLKEALRLSTNQHKIKSDNQQVINIFTDLSKIKPK